MTDSTVCPVCMKQLNNQNRLITEDCGHSKCRQCLIAEANGCEKCLQNSNESNKSSANEALPTNIVGQVQVKKNQRSNPIPPHIEKSCSDDNQVIYHCTICDKHFKSRTQQYYHIFCNNASNKPFKCDKCSKSFSTSAHLKYHNAGHLQQTFKCSFCGKIFFKIQILQKHEKLHTAVGEQCSECGAKLRNKESLVAHLNRHQNILPFECDKCDKKFSLRTSLRMHQQVVHIATKKFKCDDCGKVFNRNSTLKTHKLSHTSQKEYSCSKCSRNFIDKKSLLRHSRIHVGKSKFKCSLCDTASIRKDNILRHLRNMHPNQDNSFIEEVSEEIENSDNDNSNGEDLPKQLEEPTNYTELISDVPKVVAHSSVIRCIGNVKPVSIIEEKQTEVSEFEKETPSEVTLPAASIHKKIKKTYDPCEMYRKILLDDDSEQYNDTSCTNEGSKNPQNDPTKQLVQESSVICNGQQSNFSETHWRKNFKHNYQIQFD